MIDPEAFRFGAYQTATFYNNLQATATRLLPKLLGELGDQLDGDPVTLPLPPQAPPEVPRLILQSADQSLRMEVSLLRVDVRWQRTVTAGQPELPQFCGFATKAHGLFQEVVGARSGRLALVVQRYQLHQSPGMALSAHFCRPELVSNQPHAKGPLNRPENFELHAHKTYHLGRFPINSWMRCKTGVLAVAEVGQPIILVEQDLNTVAEGLEKQSYGVADLQEFYGLTVPELDAIARLYFPPAAH